jgi:DNA-binding response OmpR family regulator
MPRVLIVEDDELIAKGMATHPAQAGFDPLWMGNGEAGPARLRFERPDVCVLDLMMPLLDGWKLIETARAEGTGTPILVAGARGSEQTACMRSRSEPTTTSSSRSRCPSSSRASGSPPAGAFAPRRFSAARRSKSRARRRSAKLSSLCRRRKRGAHADRVPLLYALASDRRVLTRDELLQKIWGRRLTRRDRTVDVFVRKLREKIDKRAPRHSFVHTRYGVGYKLEAQPKENATLEARSGSV